MWTSLPGAHCHTLRSLCSGHPGSLWLVLVLLTLCLARLQGLLCHVEQCWIGVFKPTSPSSWNNLSPFRPSLGCITLSGLNFSLLLPMAPDNNLISNNLVSRLHGLHQIWSPCSRGSLRVSQAAKYSGGGWLVCWQKIFCQVCKFSKSLKF